MSKNKKQNLATASADELNTLISDAKKTLFNLRFQKAAGDLKNHRMIRVTKKQIARLYTELTNKI